MSNGIKHRAAIAGREIRRTGRESGKGQFNKYVRVVDECGIFILLALTVNTCVCVCVAYHRIRLKCATLAVFFVCAHSMLGSPLFIRKNKLCNREYGIVWLYLWNAQFLLSQFFVWRARAVAALFPDLPVGTFGVRSVHTRALGEHRTATRKIIAYSMRSRFLPGLFFSLARYN